MRFVTLALYGLLMAAASGASTITLSTTCQANTAGPATVTNAGSCSSWYEPHQAIAYAQSEGNADTGFNNIRATTTQHAWYREHLPIGNTDDLSIASVNPTAFAETSVRIYGITDGPIRPGKLTYVFSADGVGSPHALTAAVHAWFKSTALGIYEARVDPLSWSVDTTLGQRFDITTYSTLVTLPGSSDFTARWATTLDLRFFEADGHTPVRVTEVAPVPEPGTLLITALILLIPVLGTRFGKQRSGVRS